MAPPVGRSPDDLNPPPEAAPGSAGARLASEPFAFDFFQAVRLLHLLRPGAAEVGRAGPVEAEAVRFRALASVSFPPSAVMDLQPSDGGPSEPPTMTVGFLGLIGPKGVLPQRYTELVMRQENEREVRDREKGALRAWFDLFNHRLTGLFYRAWEKYRFVVPFERASRRGGPAGGPDPFTAALLGFVGLGTGGLRGRLRRPGAGSEPGPPSPAAVDDLALLYYAGLFADRTRHAVGLEAILRDYFGLPVTVRQFQGQWLTLGEEQQSRLGGGPGARNALGKDVVAGTRVWEIRSKIRVRLGPLSYDEFRAFLPDPERPGSFFALSHLVRLYAGPDLDFDVQLVLKRDAVPPCRVGGDPGDGGGAVLGWNSWVAAGPLDREPGDAIFPAVEPGPGAEPGRPA